MNVEERRNALRVIRTKYKGVFSRNRYRHRSAKTGRFVSAAFAARHPKTTVRERV